MNKDIYEVERDDYAGFIGQLNKQMMDVEQEYQEHSTILKIISKTTGTLLCKRIVSDEGHEQYFVYNMPESEERIEPKPVLKIKLNNKEEVQKFFNILNQLQQEKHND